MSKELTERQKEILGFIKSYIEESGYPPSLREISAKFGIKGPKNAGKHLKALEKKGYIRRSANISRAIELLGDDTSKHSVTVPVAGRVRAGSPHLAVEDIAGYVVLDGRFFKCKDAFLLKVEGDSMLGAGIDDGDYVMVRPQAHANENEIIVAMVDGEATVKRFSRQDNTIILKPENPWMDPIIVKEGKDFHIIGKVISIIKHLER